MIGERPLGIVIAAVGAVPYPTRRTPPARTTTDSPQTVVVIGSSERDRTA